MNKYTIQAIGKTGGGGIRKLELNGFGDIGDSSFSSIFPNLPNLRHLSLKLVAPFHFLITFYNISCSVISFRGCAKVGEATVVAVAENCPLLNYINLNYTAATPSALGKLLSSCAKLEVLKIAAVPKMVGALYNLHRGLSQGYAIRRTVSLLA